MPLHPPQFLKIKSDFTILATSIPEATGVAVF